MNNQLMIMVRVTLMSTKIMKKTMSMEKVTEMAMENTILIMNKNDR